MWDFPSSSVLLTLDRLCPAAVLFILVSTDGSFKTWFADNVAMARLKNVNKMWEKFEK